MVSIRRTSTFAPPDAPHFRRNLRQRLVTSRRWPAISCGRIVPCHATNHFPPQFGHFSFWDLSESCLTLASPGGAQNGERVLVLGDNTHIAVRSLTRADAPQRSCPWSVSAQSERSMMRREVCLPVATVIDQRLRGDLTDRVAGPSLRVMGPGTGDLPPGTRTRRLHETRTTTCRKITARPLPRDGHVSGTGQWSKSQSPEIAELSRRGDIGFSRRGVLLQLDKLNPTNRRRSPVNRNQFR